MFLTSFLTLSKKRYFGALILFLNPIIITVTPALPLALLDHLKDW